jgi:LacI family transcriptional regulator
VVRARGGACSDEYVAECFLGREEGRRAMGLLLSRSIEIDGVFACDDLRAFGAVDAIRERGLKVPRDISVVGFDDIPEASSFDPPLTTVRHPRFEIGYKSVELLKRLIAGESGPGPLHEIVKCELVERASVSPVRRLGRMAAKT